jgi:hypothetical protein
MVKLATCPDPCCSESRTVRSNPRTDVQCTEENFGRGVVHGADKRLLGAALVQERRRAKIDQAHVKVAVHQNVFVLDVAMRQVLYDRRMDAPPRAV